ncbi:MAG: cyclopropane-fatty-acyl-phospholipid synthase [Paraburkholderia sp.]|uniref:cyclopropane-fatty-acyl-phospholipid synthase family protein n=1 Tax=Paraburkholderia sp. TaxID=1926495 RepID=UPI002AFEE0F5|nr:cyclopropane-fatty-acyl-phospholipid synthase family protein [Paraburkholderia sp.]MEA3084042.1 cyclopropane-fatty-acyl-phospholipid synthase [Paraburkholderia sp.]
MLNQLMNLGIETWVTGIRRGHNLPIQLNLWNGKSFDLGVFESPVVRVHVRDPSALPLLFNSDVDSLTEAYVTERIDVDGKLEEVVDAVYRMPARSRPASRTNHSRQGDKTSSRYYHDVSNDFYKLWLDERMVFSCGYFENGNETLDQAQLKKIDRVLSEIDVQPGQRLLDIGCGWGALVMRAAATYGARCVGVTLSENQYQLATERVRAAGLSDKVEIRLADYRDVRGRFERITRVGMFEHIGRDALPSYFSKVRGLLADNGILIDHRITPPDSDKGDTQASGSEFLGGFMFPSGEPSHISGVTRALHESGLEAVDVQNLGRYCATTLRCWAERYEQHTERIRQTVGETKYRTWRVFLAGCAHAFSTRNASAHQIVCRKAGGIASMRSVAPA